LRLLAKNREKRITTATEIINHPFFREFNFEKLRNYQNGGFEMRVPVPQLKFDADTYYFDPKYKTLPVSFCSQSKETPE
jgi:hypothetical protein